MSRWDDPRNRGRDPQINLNIRDGARQGRSRSRGHDDGPSVKIVQDFGAFPPGAFQGGWGGGGGGGGGPPPWAQPGTSGSRSRSRERHGSDDWAELRRMKSDRDREAAVAEFKRQQDEEHRKIEEAIKRHELEEQEQKERDKEIVAKWQADQKKKEEDKKRIAEEYEREVKEKKEKQEKEYKERMSKDLAKFGFKENQVDAIVGHKSANEVALAQRPTYPRVRVEYLEEKTLKKSNLPYHRDELDPNFWCIDTPISDELMERLFKHTAKIRHEREEKLLLEDKKHGHGHKREPEQFVQVRRARSKSQNRDKSPARGKSRDRGGDKLTGPERLVANLFLRD